MNTDSNPTVNATPWTFDTVTGKRIDILNPDPALIDLEDVAHSLSMQCRYGGHLPQFYSVAAHSLLVGYLAGPDGLDAVVQLEPLSADEEFRVFWMLLLHDAAEAYVADVISPMKEAMRTRSREAHEPCPYDVIEEQWHEAVAKRFGLTAENNGPRHGEFVNFVTQMDICAFVAESLVLRGQTLSAIPEGARTIWLKHTARRGMAHALVGVNTLFRSLEMEQMGAALHAYPNLRETWNTPKTHKGRFLQVARAIGIK